MTRKDRTYSGWTRVALFVSIGLSLFLIAIGRAGQEGGTAGRVMAQESAAPLAALVSIPVQSVENYFQKLADRRAVYEDNLDLKAEIAVLRERQGRYENLAMKVARYEAILGVDTETDIPLRKIAARAVGESDGPFVRSLLINVGRNDGVVIGNPVMSTDGMVGHIINVGAHSARVLRLSDLNSRIPVASARTGATAILAGDNTINPKLSFISQRLDWKLGDHVISSGDDGSLPRGLAVGIVIQDENGGLRVSLDSRKNPIDWLWVSPFIPVAPPLDEDVVEADPS